MNVGAILKEAWAQVEAADLPEPMREAAFREAIRLLSDSSGGGASRGGGRSGSGGDSAGGAGGGGGASDTKKHSPKKTASAASTTGTETPSEDEFFQSIEDETGISRDRLEQVIYLDAGTPKINVPARQLGSTLKSRQVAVATIIPVVRHYGLREDEVAASAVREECDRLRCADRNLAKNSKGIPGIILSGGRTKVLKVRPAAAVTFESAVNRLLDGDEATASE